MKEYTESERQEHVENWQKGGMSKTSYSKSAGIHPTTFCTWVKKHGGKGNGFIEIKSVQSLNTFKEMVIEKGNVRIQIPFGASVQELENILNAVGKMP
jgi:transposase-like protein